jgi:hypothetical protein
MHKKITWFLRRALRILLREIVRCLRHDLNIPHFCLNLMMDRMRDKFDTFRDFEYKVSSCRSFSCAIPGLKSRNHTLLLLLRILALSNATGQCCASWISKPKAKSKAQLLFRGPKKCKAKKCQVKNTCQVKINACGITIIMKTMFKEAVKSSKVMNFPTVFRNASPIILNMMNIVAGRCVAK